MAQEVVRLSVNMNKETAEKLRAIVEARGCSYTEAIRRCILVYAFFEEEHNNGRIISTSDSDGRNRQDLIFVV